MDDYVDYITPQFSRTDINFQRIPTVDTSNPFISPDVPSEDESLVVVRIKKVSIFKYDMDLSNLKICWRDHLFPGATLWLCPVPK